MKIMFKTYMRDVAAVMIVAVAVLLLAGCEKPPASEIVEERAAARWSDLLEGEYRNAWEYYPPGFRSANSRDDFAIDMRHRQIRWISAEVLDAQCDEDRCTVVVTATYRPARGPSEHRRISLSRELEEIWIRVDGQWWYTEN